MSGRFEADGNPPFRHRGASDSFVRKKILHASVFTDPNEIVQHLVGLKDVRVLSYARRGPQGEITIEQRDPDLSCPRCNRRAWVKDRPVVSYVDLPFGGVPITIKLEKAPPQMPEQGLPAELVHLV